MTQAMEQNAPTGQLNRQTCKILLVYLKR